MTFDVKTTVQVNDIQFGMDRKEVRKLNKNRYNEFKKSIFSKNTTDDFRGFHVYYNTENKCEAVEIFDFDEIIINGKTVGKSVDDYKAVLSDLEYEDGGYISKEASVGITEEDGQVAAILFGCAGYYD